VGGLGLGSPGPPKSDPGSLALKLRTELLTLKFTSFVNKLLLSNYISNRLKAGAIGVSDGGYAYPHFLQQGVQYPHFLFSELMQDSRKFRFDLGSSSKTGNGYIQEPRLCNTFFAQISNQTEFNRDQYFDLQLALRKPKTESFYTTKFP
jgi:hypothetical protein